MTANADHYAGWAAGVSREIVVVGDGIIGLSIAYEVARRGGNVTVLGRRQQGAATWASGGLLAPSTGPLPAEAAPFFYASLAEYSAFVARLAEFAPGLELVTGLIELGAPARAEGADGESSDTRELDRPTLAGIEPTLAWRPGALLHPRDGAVNPRLLLTALKAAAAALPGVEFRGDAQVQAIKTAGEDVAIITRAGAVLHAGRVVLAAGAWTPHIRGLPRAIPVTPLKGQMLELGACPLGHPVLADHTYLVPRGEATLVGSTSDDTGFDILTDPAVIVHLAATAAMICPALVGAPVVASWAGLRPMTPDRLPIICADPEFQRVVYACGHGRNGILLAPATAEAVADLLAGIAPRNDLQPFAIDRTAFRGQAR
jgi:glycine oxidase